MNFLLIQERGRHEANREFREALSMQRALESMGHNAMVWGLGYPNFDRPFDMVSKGMDVVFLMEQYDQVGWVPYLGDFKGPRVFWTIDSHCNLDEHRKAAQRHNITHLLSSTSSYLPYYDSPVKEWFPNCYDDTLIMPLPEVEKVHPIGFCGNDNGRLEWLRVLESAIGIKPKADIFVIGQAMVKAINGYQIHFNRNIRDDINYRTFETAGCGVFLVTNHTWDIESLFVPGKEIAIYYNGADLIEQVRHFLENPAEREAIAAAGHARAKRDHTYKNRARMVCDILQST